MVTSELRHKVKVEFNNKFTIDEKIIFLNQLKTAQGDMSYTKIESSTVNNNVMVEFSSNDGDCGKLELLGESLYVQVCFSFDRLKSIYDYIILTYPEDIVDILEANTQEELPSA